MVGWRAALAGALVLAAINTLGDFIWAHYIPSHRVIFGLMHGTLLLLVLGLYLGSVRGRPALGALGGAVVGLASAGSFYVLARFIERSAMFVSWMALWIGFALLDARLLRRLGLLSEALVRGVLAAVGSGSAFYAISGIWTRPRPGGPDYGYNFLCWTLAFLPGFMALLLTKPTRP